MPCLLTLAIRQRGLKLGDFGVALSAPGQKPAFELP
jgi:hypothetical protein